MVGPRCWIDPGERPPAACDGGGIGARTLPRGSAPGGRRGASCMIIVWSSLCAGARVKGPAGRAAPSRDAGAGAGAPTPREEGAGAGAPPRAEGAGAGAAPPRAEGKGAGPRADGAGAPVRADGAGACTEGRGAGAGAANRGAGAGAGAPAAGRGAGARAGSPRRAGGSSAGREMICVGSSSVALGRRGRGSPFRLPPPPSFRFMCARDCTGPGRTVQSLVFRSRRWLRASPR